MAAALLVIGAALELAGIVSLGFPDFVPWGPRLSRWLRRLENRLRRLVGWKPRGAAYDLGAAAGEFNIAGHMSGLVSAPSAGTLEQKVEYLLRRDQDAQRRENELAARVNRLETESPRQLAESQRAMEQHVAHELKTALAEYRELRIAGTILLAIGLGCVTAATVLG